jgi:Sulfotransferase domain
MCLRSTLRGLAQHIFGSNNVRRDFALTANYLLGRYRKEVIWVVGDGRSGTTWLSSIINWHGRYREMFEPFHPELVPMMRSLRPFQYVRVGSLAGEFRDLVDMVFSGRLRDARVDSQTAPHLHSGLLVKDIFAHLFVAAVLHELPAVKLVLIIRNPVDVALSKLKLRSWWWPEGPRLFLDQENLMKDYLHPFEAQIASCSSDFVVRQVMIWAILHYVLLRQRRQFRAHVVFYESLRGSPERELTTLFHFLQVDALRDGLPVALLDAIKSPSRMSQKRSSESDPQCSPQQLAEIADVLATFGLDKLYDNDRMPTQAAAHLAGSGSMFGHQSESVAQLIES